MHFSKPRLIYPYSIKAKPREVNGRFFVCLFFFFHIYYGVKILHVIYFNTDAQSITWFEPPPVRTVSDNNFVHTSTVELYEESINEQLNWRFSLTQQLAVVSIELEDATVVATVLQPSGSVTVSPAFTSRVNVTWVPGHVTLIIFNVTASDEKTFTCRLTVPGTSWRSSIIVDVVGNLTVY